MAIPGPPNTHLIPHLAAHSKTSSLSQCGPRSLCITRAAPYLWQFCSNNVRVALPVAYIVIIISSNPIILPTTKRQYWSLSG
jgi:hypothetical protein